MYKGEEREKKKGMGIERCSAQRTASLISLRYRTYFDGTYTYMHTNKTNNDNVHCAVLCCLEPQCAFFFGYSVLNDDHVETQYERLRGVMTFNQPKGK